MLIRILKFLLYVAFGLIATVLEALHFLASSISNHFKGVKKSH